MSEQIITSLYRLFAEAERLEFLLLGEYYSAKTPERHHQLLSICDRAYKRKERRRKACMAAATHQSEMNQSTV